ncbi:GNAT family N-acetyltransferase [Leptobacterium flavescens]|uniref:GNAT family N-acetyltransferase n=1 Tax=Leptobacterium flavescens TaxID=472055 RepID=A0A6P0URA4_9FLAO|nr:GNAT family N-acetyltransferase [Leptobacterium flavescens]NER14299.1 GNAT family N-acetyltransferase [Leptobacterium flavescens]
MNIRLASENDIERVLKVTRACNLHMRTNGIAQWTDDYPSRESFKLDVSRKELYVLESKNKVIGCIVISTYMDEVYKPVRWLTPNKNNIYVHRLAVDPGEQGKGLAQKLMDYAENYARMNKFVSLRLDTFSQNPRNQKFYEVRGYKRLENIALPEQSEYPFYCYEYVLI